MSLGESVFMCDREREWEGKKNCLWKMGTEKGKGKARDLGTLF